jgi:hypothetical protein
MSILPCQATIARQLAPVCTIQEQLYMSRAILTHGRRPFLGAWCVCHIHVSFVQVMQAAAMCWKPHVNLLPWQAPSCIMLVGTEKDGTSCTPCAAAATIIALSAQCMTSRAAQLAGATLCHTVSGRKGPVAVVEVYHGTEHRCTMCINSSYCSLLQLLGWVLLVLLLLLLLRWCCCSGYHLLQVCC